MKKLTFSCAFIAQESFSLQSMFMLLLKKFCTHLHSCTQLTHKQYSVLKNTIVVLTHKEHNHILLSLEVSTLKKFVLSFSGL